MAIAGPPERGRRSPLTIVAIVLIAVGAAATLAGMGLAATSEIVVTPIVFASVGMVAVVVGIGITLRPRRRMRRRIAMLRTWLIVSIAVAILSGVSGFMYEQIAFDLNDENETLGLTSDPTAVANLIAILAVISVVTISIILASSGPKED